MCPVVQTALKQKHAAQNAVVAQGSRIAAATALDPSTNPFLQPPREAEGEDAAAAIFAGLPAPAAPAAGGQLLLLEAGEPAEGGAAGAAAPGAVQAAFSGLLEAAGAAGGQASTAGWRNSSEGPPGDDTTAAAAAAAAGSSGKGPPLAFQIAAASRQLPAGLRRSQAADAYAAKLAQDGMGTSGKRSHRSKYDADPRLVVAEAILNAPEEVNMPPPVRARGRAAAFEEVFDIEDDGEDYEMEDVD